MYFRKPLMLLQSETKSKGCNGLDVLKFKTKYALPQKESYLCAVEHLKPMGQSESGQNCRVWSLYYLKQ